ncbi:hypothetical protein [Pseudoduganella sp. HUAS MS19]
MTDYPGDILLRGKAWKIISLACKKHLEDQGDEDLLRRYKIDVKIDDSCNVIEVYFFLKNDEEIILDLKGINEIIKYSFDSDNYKLIDAVAM